MVKTVGAERATAKWVNRAGVAGGDYEAGVRSPKTSWSTATSASKNTYQQAVSAGDIGDRFSRGVQAAGDSKWQEMAINKGVARFSDGVAKSEQYYRSGIAQQLNVIERVSLPARGPRGAAQNYERSKKIGDALHAARVSKAVTASK